ncbi:unnamed protein product, partial [marine sediment metagenome]
MYYIVSICAKRNKVTLIKLIRAMLGGTEEGWGLKESKDYVEANFCFDAWMDDDVTF